MNSVRLHDMKLIYRNLLHFCTLTGAIKLISYQKEKTISFTITSENKSKNLGINLNREVKYLYSENWKTLIKATGANTNRWTDILCAWIRRINIVKMTILPGQSTDSRQSLSK